MHSIRRQSQLHLRRGMDHILSTGPCFFPQLRLVSPVTQPQAAWVWMEPLETLSPKAKWVSTLSPKAEWVERRNGYGWWTLSGATKRGLPQQVERMGQEQQALLHEEWLIQAASQISNVPHTGGVQTVVRAFLDVEFPFSCESHMSPSARLGQSAWSS